MSVKEVEDPSLYGAVVSDTEGKVLKYVDRPKEFISNQINAGVYLFKNTVLDRIVAAPSSLELHVLPLLVKEGLLHSVAVDGVWMDVGLPHNYLIGVQLYLEYLSVK